VENTAAEDLLAVVDLADADVNVAEAQEIEYADADPCIVGLVSDVLAEESQ
jgi:hypothetical protein